MAAAAGLFWMPSNEVPLAPDLYGFGLYRRDTPFVAGASQGSDLLSLFFFVPVAAWLALSQWSTRPPFVVFAAVHAWWLYIAVSLAFGAAAFNELFPVYVALMPVCLAGLALALAGIDRPDVPRYLSPFLVFCGVITIAAWASLLWAEMATGQFPPTTYYTVRTTYALDLGLIAPGCLAAGLASWNRWVWWPRLAIPLLGIAASLLPMMALQTVMQLRAGVEFGPEALGPFVGFGLISPAALWFLRQLARATG